MKRIQFLISVLLLVVVLAACGSNDNNNNNDTGNNDGTNDNQTEQNEENNGDTNDNDSNDNNNVANNDNNNDNANNDNDDSNNDNANEDSEFYKMGMKERMDDLPFTVINFKVAYDDGNEYQLDIAYRNDYVNIHLQDDFEEEYLRGRDAFNIIHPSLEELDINPDTDDAEAISQIIEAFDLNDDYTEFKLEMEFDDGTLEVEE